MYPAGQKPLASLTGNELVTVDNGGATFVSATTQQIANKAVSARGTFTANAGTAVTVANAAITANSVVTFGLKTVGGTIAGAPFMTTVTPGTGFTVNAGAGDTSVYNYAILG